VERKIHAGGIGPHNPRERTAQEANRGADWETLELDEAWRKVGGTISGKFKFNTTAFEEEKKP